MNTNEIITASLAGINLLIRSIEAAQAGQMEEAHKNFVKAGAHVTSAIDGWDAAPGPKG